MKKSIWKFVLDTTDKQELEMPKGAELLSVQEQHGQPCLWALVDPNEVNESRIFEIFGTGHPVPYDMEVKRKFIGTYQLAEGDFIGHLFERINLMLI